MSDAQTSSRTSFVPRPVTLFANPSFKGNSVELSIGKHRLSDYPAFASGQIACVRVPDGMRVRLNREQAAGGGFIAFDESERDLTASGWSRRIESVTVEAAVPETDEIVMGYNYILGTQAFRPLYSFSNENAVYEAAMRIYRMGSNTIKLHDVSDYRAILRDMDFRYIYLWLRTDETNWRDGLSAIEAEAEYDYVYKAVKDLLTVYNNSGKTFYLGHWEGDWYLVDNYNAGQQSVSEIRIQGMIDWLNIRQKAIDDAKKAISHRNVYVWGYTEANRTSDAVSSGADRLANRVLPYVAIDYVSYSAYDIQGMSPAQIKSHFEYMETRLRPKPGVPGKRIFVGETALPSVLTGNSQESHNAVNIDFLCKFFDVRAGQILFWQMYNNEISSGIQQGYWLIDNNNVKWKLYYSFKAYYDNSREYVRAYNRQYGKTPSLDTFSDWAAGFLKTLR